MILKVFSYLNDSMINDFVSPHNNLFLDVKQ